MGQSMSSAVEKVTSLVTLSRSKPLQDAIFYLGLYYLTKTALSFTTGTYRVFKTFILPSVWPRYFRKEYGQWAVVTGCTAGIGLGYVEALAENGMDIVLVGRTRSKLDNVAKNISKSFSENNHVRIKK